MVLEVNESVFYGYIVAGEGFFNYLNAFQFISLQPFQEFTVFHHFLSFPYTAAMVKVVQHSSFLSWAGVRGEEETRGCVLGALMLG